MAKAKLTSWFPADMKPARPGVYEARNPSGFSGFAAWNGRGWGWLQRSVRDADLEGVLHGGSQRKTWRGLASNPKAKP